MGSNQYESTSGITLENVKNEDSLSSQQQNEDNITSHSSTQSIRKTVTIKLWNCTRASLANTEESSSFVPTMEKDSQAFKDPLAAAISKATDRLIEQHQKTTQSQTSATNNPVVNNKNVSTVVPLLK